MAEIPSRDERLARTRLLLGDSGLERLEASCVAVAGLGAVGSHAVEALARAGIGRLILIDFDAVKASNLNRQLYALVSTLGRRKTEIAAERVRDINPDCEVTAQPVFLDEANFEDVFFPPSGPPDFVIDAIDSLGPKVGLISRLVRRGLPFVSCLGAACRTDPSRVLVSDIGETHSCPLASKVRGRLRRIGIAEGVRCVWSSEPVIASSPIDAEPAASPVEEETLQRGRTRQPIGSISYMPGIFGYIAASEAIRFLLDRRINQENPRAPESPESIFVFPLFPPQLK